MKRFIGLFLIILLLSIHSLHAAFIEQAGAIRSISMGRSGVAYADGIEALVVNPAGLANAKKKQFSMEYHRPFTGTENSGAADVPGYYAVDIVEGFAGFAMPVGESEAIGISWANFASKPLYTENIFTVGWAFNCGNTVKLLEGEDINFGFNLKFMSLEYGKDQYTAALFTSYGNSASGLNIDAGMDYGLSKNIRLALAAKNLYPMDTGIVGRETLPSEFNLGMLYSGRLNAISTDLKLTAQLGGRPNTAPGGINPAFGAEFIPTSAVSLRSGLNGAEFSFGLGIRFIRALEINYSLSVPYGMQGNVISHRFGTVFYWQ